MTNARRQAAGMAVAVTITVKEHDRLVVVCEHLREELPQAHREIGRRSRRIGCFGPAASG